MTAPAVAQHVPLDAALRDRIDAFVERERQASGIPGIALAIVQTDGSAHLRGFGDDGRGNPITADTPFPIGSLTKSFTALLVRQAIDAGQLDADAPVQRYLPWFRVADVQAATSITLRHLLNQTSGFSRADGMALLLQGSHAGIDEVARRAAALSLNRPVGQSYEYSNLNFVLLGAVLQAVSGQSWQNLVRDRVLLPLAMSRSFTDIESARRVGMTAVHRTWFGFPIAQELQFPQGFAPTGALISSASDMARYLQMLLARGAAPTGRVLSGQGVAQLLTPASPPGRSNLLSTEFQFRYVEGWFVGPFGAATDARWHLGNLPSFAAWMVLLPDTRQAVVVLINANSELPVNRVNAVMSRIPVGVVNLLRGQAPPQGPNLRSAYLPFTAAAALVIVLLAALAWRAARVQHSGWSAAMAFTALALAAALKLMGLSMTMLWAFAPDLLFALSAAGALLCLPAALRVWRWIRRRSVRASAGVM
jgi:CubicO group peptidase (beta-lactamase class C family)